MVLVAALFLAVLVGAGWLLAEPEPGTSASSGAGAPGAVLAAEDHALQAQATNDAVPVDDNADEVSGADQPALPEVTYELVLTRDPFEPVRPEPEPEVDAPPAPTDPSRPAPPAPSPTPSPTDPSRPSPTPTPGQPDPPRPGDPCVVGAESTVCEGTTVKVLDTTASGARIQVGDVVHPASIGESFAQRYRLLDVQGGCALIRYDDRQTFRQCPVESTFK